MDIKVAVQMSSLKKIIFYRLLNCNSSEAVICWAISMDYGVSGGICEPT